MGRKRRKTNLKKKKQNDLHEPNGNLGGILIKIDGGIWWPGYVVDGCGTFLNEEEEVSIPLTCSNWCPIPPSADDTRIKKSLVTPNPNPQQNHTVRVARPCHSNRKGQVKLNVTQQQCLKLIFHGNVHLRKELKRKECEEAIAAHSCLKGLEWKKIKNTIHNWITSKKIKTKKMLKQQER